MEQIKAEPEIIALYQHGIISSTNHPGQIVITCLFCDKQDHMYISPREVITDTGRTYQPGSFDCKSCGKAGNLYTILNHIYAKSGKETTLEDVTNLAAERKIPISSFRFSKPVKSCYNGRWLFPHYSLKNEKKQLTLTLNNLYIYSPNDKIKMKSTASCKQTLFNLQTLTEPKKVNTIWLTEGHWDCCILENELRKTINNHESIRVLATPGANVFNSKWSEHFEGKNVNIVFDNDDAGRSGMKRVCSMLQGSKKKPKSIKVIKWREETTKGFDIRDLYLLDKI